MESFCCRPSGQGCRFTRVVMESCSGYFHIKQNIKDNPFEANPEFTIKQIITYLSILQAISGSERKTFQSKNLTFTNFYKFITKTNALHFRSEGGRGGSHWDISLHSHFSDTRDDTLIVPFLSLLLIHSSLGVSIGSPFLSFVKSIFYTLGEDIQST